MVSELYFSKAVFIKTSHSYLWLKIKCWLFFEK